MTNGINYFPFPTVLDQKRKLMRAHFGSEALYVEVLIMMQIYGEDGYFCKWSDDASTLFSVEHGIKKERLDRMIKEMVKREIFDKDLYENYGILTSAEIQENFFLACKRRKKVKVIEEYILCDVCNYNFEFVSINDDADISSENADISSKNANIFQQRRVEESRGDKSRVEERRTPLKNDCISEDAEPAAAATTATAQTERSQDPEKVAELYNSLCVSLPPIHSLTNSRENAIYEISDTVIKWGGFEKLFKTVEASDFLKGKNKLKWICDFDWLIRHDNAVKVMEGKFNDKKGDDGSFDTDAFFESALKNSYGDMPRICSFET